MLKDLLDLISNWYRKIFLSRTPATNSEPLLTAQSLRNSESKLDITIDSENSENECYKFQIKSRLDEMKNTFLSQLPKFNYEKEICVIYAENTTDEYQIVNEIETINPRYRNAHYIRIRALCKVYTLDQIQEGMAQCLKMDRCTASALVLVLRCTFEITYLYQVIFWCNYHKVIA